MSYYAGDSQNPSEFPTNFISPFWIVIEEKIPMETESNEQKKQPSPVVSSCRKKKNEEATFLEDVKDHIGEFIHASMDEHKSCFKKTVQKMFGMSKIVAERNAEVKEVESSVSLRTVVSD